MSIKRMLVCLALIIIMSTPTVITGCTIITGSGDLVTEDYSYRDFTDIEAGYAFDIEVSQADTYLVSITVDDNLYEYLDVTQRGDTLHISLQPNRLYTNATLRAVIEMPDLHRLELSGASRADVSGFSSSHSVDFELSGGSRMDIHDIKAGDVSIEFSGASKADGSIDMADGTFDLSGASLIELEGSAEDVSIDASGASRASLADFSVVNADIDLSGASHTTITASDELDVNLSGASKVVYIGNPRINSTTSGASSISQQ